MPKATPEWRKYLPEFIGELYFDKDEDGIRKACEAMKKVVVRCYPNTPSSRKNPMTDIRKAVKDKFPDKEATSKDAPFPYFYTESGKGNEPRWEHLAIKYLAEEWNPQTDWSDKEVVKQDEPSMKVGNVEVVKQDEPSMKIENVEVVKQDEPAMNVEVDILGYIGLTPDEFQAVKQAIADSDLKEWLKQAVMQRANAINALNEVLTEDLSMVPSEELMTNKKYRTNSNACRELTSRAVRAIKIFNADSPEHRWCITNALISEITGNTVKAIAKAVEGMDLESYNKSLNLTPVNNRLTKAAIGEVTKVVSIKDVLGIDE